MSRFFLTYSKQQQGAILFLILCIVVFQGFYFYIKSNNEKVNTNTYFREVTELNKQIDSLQLVAGKKVKKLHKFNPNYITDFKGYQLGMRIEEIDRLHRYRKQHKWINSVSDFKRVTKINDSLLAKIAPYFKFPDWVIKKQRKPKKYISTHDINKATVEDFKTISGIGAQLASRIIKYRSKLKGFSFNNQLFEVWGLQKEIAQKTLQTFSVIEKPSIVKTNINTATFKDVLKNPYINYELCKKIFDYRDEVAELQNISELKNIKNFPSTKYNKIILYLVAK